MPTLTETQTRKALIDPALKRAGWDVHNPDQVGIEIPVDGFDPVAWKALEAKLRITISVDMLETGVNVPEVVNLVFMRPVQSRIKLGLPVRPLGFPKP